MNPLGGGVIPDHPELFKHIRREGESTVTAALRILWDHPVISVTLVGFDTIEHVNEALQAIEGYKPRTIAELEEAKSKTASSFEGICTGCAYCDNCPQDIPIPCYMDAYNQKLLDKNNKDPIGDRLKWHWNLERSGAGKCVSCGLCEEACTQHIDIINRLKEIAG
jgi:predicted aldo/keto reductase-like oxidoreductase